VVRPGPPRPERAENSQLDTLSPRACNPDLLWRPRSGGRAHSDDMRPCPRLTRVFVTRLLGVTCPLAEGVSAWLGYNARGRLVRWL
jgi:hypothetical protein